MVQVQLEVKVPPSASPPEADAAQVADVKAVIIELEHFESVRHAQPNYLLDFAQRQVFSGGEAFIITRSSRVSISHLLRTSFSRK